MNEEHYIMYSSHELTEEHYKVYSSHEQHYIEYNSHEQTDEHYIVCSSHELWPTLLTHMVVFHSENRQGTFDIQLP